MVSFRLDSMGEEGCEGWVQGWVYEEKNVLNLRNISIYILYNDMRLQWLIQCNDIQTNCLRSGWCSSDPLPVPPLFHNSYEIPNGDECKAKNPFIERLWDCVTEQIFHVYYLQWLELNWKGCWMRAENFPIDKTMSSVDHISCSLRNSLITQ